MPGLLSQVWRGHQRVCNLDHLVVVRPAECFVVARAGGGGRRGGGGGGGADDAEDGALSQSHVLVARIVKAQLAAASSAPVRKYGTLQCSRTPRALLEMLAFKQQQQQQQVEARRRATLPPLSRLSLPNAPTLAVYGHAAFVLQ